MNDENPALGRALEKLAAENAAITTPAEVEFKVLAAFDARRKRANRPRSIPVLIAAAALSASCAIAVFSLHRTTPPPAVVEAPFIVIPYVAPPAPYERTEVKRMDVPLAALIAAGLDVHGTDSSASVRADVLIGQDGRALAIRLVRSVI